MRTFEQMVAFLAPATPDQTWFEPGPSLPDVPGRFVCLTRYGGPGEQLEGVMDSISWQIRVAGLQMNYIDAESLADSIDRRMMSVTTANIGGVHVAGISRVGGAPASLLQDDADRTQFTCSYIVDTEFPYINPEPVGMGGGRVFLGEGELPGDADLTNASRNDYYLDVTSGTLYNATGASV